MQVFFLKKCMLGIWMDLRSNLLQKKRHAVMIGLHFIKTYIHSFLCFLKNNLQDMSLLRYPAGGIWQNYWHLAWKVQQDLIDLNSFCGWGENRLQWRPMLWPVTISCLARRTSSWKQMREGKLILQVRERDIYLSK